MCLFRCGCLHYPKGQIPLKSINIEVNIIDFTANVCLKQTFQNKEKNPLEAIFSFQLPDNCVISNFIAEIDGKKIEGVCKEKEQAKNDYDDAIASGHGSYLLEQNEESMELFQTSIGNLPPEKTVTIEITYITELEVIDESIHFSIPTMNETSTNSPYNQNFNVESYLKAQLDMTSNIKTISSPSHPIEIEFGKKSSQATITLNQNKAIQKDFEIFIKLTEPYKPCGRVQINSEKEKCAMIALYPNLEIPNDEDIINEIIFVLDRSGSMSGSRIRQLSNTMKILLKSLPEGTFFNIIGFGSNFEKLFNQSVEYNNENLEKAMGHVNNLEANLGGTEVLPPLMSIFSERTKEGIPRQIFLLTDGEVQNTEECIQTVRKQANTTRVFTFGIGSGASRKLIMEISKAGEGSFEFIEDEKSMEDKVLKQLNKAIKPALTDLKISWGNKLQVLQNAPFRLPPLFGGSRMIVYGFLDKNSQKDEIILTAKSGKNLFKTSIHLNPNELIEGNLFHKLAAKKLIRDLEEGRSYLHEDNGSIKKGKSEKDIKEEIISLSTKYMILSKYTAFVAIENRKDPTTGEMKKIEMKIHQERVLNGPIFSHHFSNVKRKVRSMATVKPTLPTPILSPTLPTPILSPTPLSRCEFDTSIPPPSSFANISILQPSAPSIPIFSKGMCMPHDKKRDSPEKNKEKSSSNVNDITFLTEKQRANGSWPLFSLKSIDIETIRKSIPSSIKIPINEDIESIWMTSIVICYFTLYLSNQQTIWKMIVEKARKWIKKQEKKMDIKNIDWEQEADKFLKSQKIF
jgi:hypothetical protein